MLLLTEPGDTSQTLACRILGDPDDSYANKLREMNKNTLAYTSLAGDYYIPDQLIWCPEFSELDNYPDHREMILSEAQFIPSWGKANISKLQNQGVDMNDLIATSQVIQDHNRSESNKKDHAIISGMVAQAGLESFSRAIEHGAYPAEQFSQTIERLDAVMADLLKVKKSGNTELVRSTRNKFKQLYKESIETLQHNTKLYKNRLSLKTAKILPSMNKLEKLATKKGIMISDLQDVRVLEKIARYGHWAGRGCFAFSIVLGASEVYEAYKNDEDWITKAVGVGTETLITWAAGALLLTLTPAGWAVLAGAAITEGIALNLGGNYIETITETWVHKHLHNII